MASDGGVVARIAPGLLILYPPTSRLADPLADPMGGCERHEGEHVVVLGRDQGHHGQVEGHVRRRWEPEAVDARADAHEVGFVRPMSCPPSRIAIAAPFFV